MPHVNNSGVRIEYDVYRHGEPLVLIHGWSCEGRYWREFGYLPSLSAEFTVIVPDLRGHGRSDIPRTRDFGDARPSAFRPTRSSGREQFDKIPNICADVQSRRPYRYFCGFFNRPGRSRAFLIFSLLYRVPQSLLRRLVATTHVFSTYFSPVPVVACFFDSAFTAACHFLILVGSTMRLVRRWRLILTARYLVFVGWISRPSSMASARLIVDRVLCCCVVPRICRACFLADFERGRVSSSRAV